MRVLCLDVGEKKIGISVSDPTGTIAQGVKVYKRTEKRKDISSIKNLINEYDAKIVIIGLPKDLNGAIGKKAKEIIAFSEELKAYISIPIVLWDERFSTNEAHRIFELAHIKHKDRKPYLDVMAAQIILQGYLDAQKSL
ncbi:MAG: Holliday junction resolvase RuvX [Syntrophorhabdaceae bacterium]|nr:Holliday junction resolvase RuvX [Syntrophorhabdaceae bacterium]